MDKVNFETVKKLFLQFDPNITVEEVEVKGSDEDSHFCSLIYKLTVHIRDKDGVQSKLPVFWKKTPDNPIRLDFVNGAKQFVIENDFYVKAIPELMVPFGMAEAFPLFYGTIRNDETGEHHLALQDASCFGYVPYRKRIEGLDIAHIKLIINNVARFHAASIVKYKGDGKLLQSAYPNIKEHFWKTNLEGNVIPEMNHAWIFNTLEQIKNVLQQKGLDNYISKVEGLMNVGHDTITKLSQPPESYPAILSHGDLWTTNFLFKYDEEEEYPVGMKFVDFQLAKVTSRITDLSYFIYTSVRPEILNNDLPTLLKYYYEAFTEAIQKSDNLTTFQFEGRKLTWEYFMEEWETYRVFGVICALLYVCIMCADPDNVPNMEDVKEEDVSRPSNNPSDSDYKKSNTFSSIWEYEPMLKVLFNLIIHHV